MERKVDSMPANRLEVQQTQKLSQSMQTAIRFLSMDLDELSAEMLKSIQENPALEYMPPQKSAQDYAIMVKTRYRGSRGDYPNTDAEAPADTAMEELEQQLSMCRLDILTARVAKDMLHMLSPRGYFTQELDAFALEEGVSLETARHALEAIQSLEPVGVGAQTVEECLTLQLQAMEDVDPLCYDLVRVHLLEIGKGNLRQIAKETGATMAHVKQCVEVIRGLKPIPCSLHAENVQYIMPEFSVETGVGNELTIQFHNDYYPTFRLDGNFQRLAQTLSADEMSYARKMQSSASQLIRAIEKRQSTMEKLARIIVREQRAFFLGQYSLLPLRIEDAAKEISVHETTVYRAIQNKYLNCARGMFPLNYFFQKEVSEGISTVRIKEMIQEICRRNSKISDRAITEALEQRGITLSRRVVAKYRSQMDIPSSFYRESKGD